MATLIKKKLKAFTLIESIVSLTLISIAVGACFLLFSQVAVKEELMQKARLMVADYYTKLENGELTSQETTIDKNNLELDAELVNFRQIEDLYQVNVQIFRQGEVIYQSKKIMILREN